MLCAGFVLFMKGMVMIMKMKKNIMMAIAGMLLAGSLFIIKNPAKASAATVRCYTINSGNTTVYSNTGLSSRYGTIYGSDELKVVQVTDRYCKVTYPVARGTKTGYIATGKILTKTMGNSYRSRAKITAYKRPGGASYGYISSGDTVKVLGNYGSYTQVKYPVSGGYKYAFISSSSCNAYITSGQSSSSGSSSSSGNASVYYSSSSAAGKLATYGSKQVRCYTLASQGKLYAYKDAALRNKTTGSYIACASDEVYVQSVNLSYGSVRLSYPVSGGRKSMYFRIADIMASPSTQASNYWISKRAYTYKWASSSSRYGYVENETVTVVGRSGAYTQIIYSIGGGKYKMGFIKTDEMSTGSSAISSDPVITVNGDCSAIQRNIYNLAMASLGNRGTTYQRWAGLSSYDPYCAAYATYIANQAMIQAGYSSAQALSIVPKHVSTSKMAAWYSQRGRYHSYAAWYNSSRGVRMAKNTTISAYIPQVGDLVAIDNDGAIASGPEHTGIVISVDNDRIVLAEGNTGAGTNATRTVKTHTYYKGRPYWYRADYSKAKIVGFATPAYAGN